MNLKELKLGEMCDLIAKYKEACKALESRGIDPFNMQIVTKNTETTPKYDKNRIFRKGDKVKAVLRHGRIPNDGVPKDVILEVIADERDGIVKVLHKMGAILEIFNVYALYLELVTPVEELEPYIVVDAHTHWDVADKNVKTVAMYSKGNHPHAKEAAEAECARLNAEHRKEQSND